MNLFQLAQKMTTGTTSQRKDAICKAVEFCDQPGPHVEALCAAFRDPDSEIRITALNVALPFCDHFSQVIQAMIEQMSRETNTEIVEHISYLAESFTEPSAYLANKMMEFLQHYHPSVRFSFSEAATRSLIATKCSLQPLVHLVVVK